MTPVEILLKEYESLRRESLDSITHRTQVASFGLAAIGALVAGPFLATESVQSSWLVLLSLAVGVPAVSVLVLRMWLGEFERMVRAGAFLCWLEHRINTYVGDHVLTWESWLEFSGKDPRWGKTRLRHPYVAVVVLFTLIGVGSPILGAVAVGQELPRWPVAAPGMLISFVVGARGLVEVMKPRMLIDRSAIQEWFVEHQADDRSEDKAESLASADAPPGPRRARGE